MGGRDGPKPIRAGFVALAFDWLTRDETMCRIDAASAFGESRKPIRTRFVSLPFDILIRGRAM